jgi:hypothetical protein
MKKGNTICVSSHFPLPLYKQLRDYAEKEKRSKANVLEVAFAEFIKRKCPTNRTNKEEICQ